MLLATESTGMPAPLPVCWVFPVGDGEGASDIKTGQKGCSHRRKSGSVPVNFHITGTKITDKSRLCGRKDVFWLTGLRVQSTTVGKT